MNIVLGISGGALYALWKLLKYLFENGYGVIAVVIIVIVVIYFWNKGSDSVPSHLSPKKDSESKNVEDNEIIAEVYKPEKTPKQIPGCLPCGKTLKKDRYRIFSYIFHGGFGNTYLADDTLLNKYVAIKELFVRNICTRELQTEDVKIDTKNIGAWTDIYALGATLFNLLTGSKPPQTDDIISEGLPLFPSNVSTEMVKAVTAMMQPNRNARPQSINEVARLLSISIYEQ